MSVEKWDFLDPTFSGAVCNPRGKAKVNSRENHIVYSIGYIPVGILRVNRATNPRILTPKNRKFFTAPGDGF